MHPKWRPSSRRRWSSRSPARGFRTPAWRTRVRPTWTSRSARSCARWTRPWRICRARRRLPALAVELANGEPPQLHAVETPGVHGDHRPVRSLAARERAHAADLAEQVVDDLLVELVVGQRLFTLLQAEG